MLKTRIIPTLLYREFGLVKGVAFDSRRAVGSVIQAIKVYNMRGVDELVFVDVTATIEGKGPDFELIDELADDCFMPLTVGGGIRTLADVHRLLRVGADRVCLGTSVVEQPELVRDAAGTFGSQCVVVSIDVRGSGADARAWIRSGTVDTGLSPVDLAKGAEACGAGEILLQSIDRDGTLSGYDIATLALVTAAVSIPVIASGGAGCYADMGAALLDGGASAVAAAAMFHFTQQTPVEAKRHLAGLGVPVRL